MASILHGSARTTPRVRAELQASKEKAGVLAKRHGLSRTTVDKWRSRTSTADAPMSPRDPHSTVLTPAEEAIIIAFRQRTLLPLDDVMGGGARGSVMREHDGVATEGACATRSRS